MSDEPPTEALTEEMLDAIEAREKAATPGPWASTWAHTEHDGVPAEQLDEAAIVSSAEGLGRDNAVVVGSLWYDGPHTICREHDAAFIAAARTDVPALVADDRRLRAEVERLRAENARLVARCKGRSTPPTTAEARVVHSAGGAFVRTPFATGRRFPDVVSGLARLGSDEADGRLKPATWLVVAPDGTVGDWPVLAAKAPRKPTRKPTRKPRR